MARADRMHLDLLAKMAEDWNDQTDAMLSLAIGMVLLAQGQKEITIDLSKATEMAAQFTIDREYNEHPDGTKFMRVVLTPRL